MPLDLGTATNMVLTIHKAFELCLLQHEICVSADVTSSQILNTLLVRATLLWTELIYLFYSSSTYIEAEAKLSST